MKLIGSQKKEKGAFQVIEVWLSEFLLPQVSKGSVIVMDNAPFHKSRRIRELIENAGCELIFLPAYSPDLNPIEHWCAQVKTAFESGIPPTTKLMF